MGLPKNILVADEANELLVTDMQPREFAAACTYAQEKCRQIWGGNVRLRSEPLLLAMKEKRGLKIWRSDESMIDFAAHRGTPCCIIEAGWYDDTARVEWSAPVVKLEEICSPFEFVFKHAIDAAEKLAADYWKTIDSPMARGFRQFLGRLWVCNKDGQLWEDWSGEKTFFAVGRDYRIRVNGDGLALNPKMPVDAPESAVLEWVRGLRRRALREEAEMLRSTGDALAAAALELQAAGLEAGQ